MGLTKSRYQCGQFTALPISSLTINDGLFIIYTPDNRYIRQTEMVLTVKENKESISSKDGYVHDSNGMKWFDITAPICSRPMSRTMLDQFGNEVASYHLQAYHMYGAVFITVQTDGGHWCAATIRRKRGNELVDRCNADVFIHNPVLPVQILSTMDLSTWIHPNIKVEGNFKGKKYDFMKSLGHINGNQTQWCKIAEAARDFNTKTNCESSPNSNSDTFHLKVGANVDIAFISICCYALDELFSYKKLNKSTRIIGTYPYCSRHDRRMCKHILCHRERMIRTFSSS